MSHVSEVRICTIPNLLDTALKTIIYRLHYAAQEACNVHGFNTVLVVDLLTLYLSRNCSRVTFIR